MVEISWLCFIRNFVMQFVSTMIHTVDCVLIGALLLTIVGGAILSAMIAARRRRKSDVADFAGKEKELKAELDGLRSRMDDIVRENQDLMEELSGLQREMADRDVAMEELQDKKLEVIAQLMQTDKGGKQDATPVYARFVEVIEQQLGNSSLQIDGIGRQLNMSRVQLYRRLKAETGMTPNELLRIYRLTKAVKMLTATDLTIAEIAYRVGFSSPGYFSRCFREQFHKLPQDFRKEEK